MKISTSGKHFLCSLLFLLLFGCVAQKESPISLPDPYITQPNDGLIYDASFRYKNLQASGLLVLKRTASSNSSKYHVVLLSKFGPAIMEFTLDEKGITWIKTFDQLNKPIIKDFIAKDFRIMLLAFLENPKKIKLVKSSENLLIYKIKGKQKAKIKVDSQTNQVMYAENKGFLNLFKTKVLFFYKENDLPQNMEITHNNINLRIDLNLLKVNHAER